MVNSWGHVEVAHVSHVLPDGRTLLEDVSFRIGEGLIAALVGPNGAGKSTLLRMVAGDIQPQTGTVAASGGLGVMRQFIGTTQGHDVTPEVRDLLLSVSPPRVREAAAGLDAAELAMMERDDERTQLRYAAALGEWGEAGGYQAEVHWDACTVAALGIPFEQCRWRDVSTLSGGEQKRLVLESLLRGTDGVLLLDEPDNYLDVPGKRWLEHQLATTSKTVLLVSHDRELSASSPSRTGTSGSTAAASPATPRPGPTGSAGWRNCAVAGTRSTTSSRSWSAPTGRRPRTTPTWRPGCRPR
jgi:ATPase subunit of ABC transporter with duplicated ATPase domains